MEHALAYGVYVVAGAVTLATYVIMPKAGGSTRRGLALMLSALALGALVLLLGRLLAESGSRLYFYVLSVLTVAGAVRVVTHPRPVYSALYFVLVILSTAALMVLVGAEFLAAALVIVYAGAILVTYVFVIMLAQQSAPPGGARYAGVLDYDRSAREPGAAVLAGFVLIATVAGVIVGRDGAPTGVPVMASASEGNTLSLGRLLLTDFAVSVELAGVLLLVAMIGAIAIARKRIPQLDEGETPPPGEIGRHVKPF